MTSIPEPAPATPPRERRALTPEQRDAWARLRRLWNARPDPRDLTQEKMASLFRPPVTQGAVAQYLNGHIPLNAAAILDFARVLRVDPGEIDPSLGWIYREARKAAVLHQQLADARLDPEAAAHLVNALAEVLGRLRQTADQLPA